MGRYWKMAISRIRTYYNYCLRYYSILVAIVYTNRKINKETKTLICLKIYNYGLDFTFKGLCKLCTDIIITYTWVYCKILLLLLLFTAKIICVFSNISTYKNVIIVTFALYIINVITKLRIMQHWHL